MELEFGHLASIKRCLNLNLDQVIIETQQRALRSQPVPYDGLELFRTLI